MALGRRSDTPVPQHLPSAWSLSHDVPQGFPPHRSKVAEPREPVSGWNPRLRSRTDASHHVMVSSTKPTLSERAQRREPRVHQRHALRTRVVPPNSGTPAATSSPAPSHAHTHVLVLDPAAEAQAHRRARARHATAHANRSQSNTGAYPYHEHKGERGLETEREHGVEDELELEQTPRATHRSRSSHRRRRRRRGHRSHRAGPRSRRGHALQVLGHGVEAVSHPAVSPNAAAAARGGEGTGVGDGAPRVSPELGDGYRSSASDEYSTSSAGLPSPSPSPPPSASPTPSRRSMAPSPDSTGRPRSSHSSGHDSRVRPPSSTGSVSLRFPTVVPAEAGLGDDDAGSHGSLSQPSDGGSSHSGKSVAPRSNTTPAETDAVGVAVKREDEGLSTSPEASSDAQPTKAVDASPAEANEVGNQVVVSAGYVRQQFELICKMLHQSVATRESLIRKYTSMSLQDVAAVAIRVWQHVTTLVDRREQLLATLMSADPASALAPPHGINPVRAACWLCYATVLTLLVCAGFCCSTAVGCGSPARVGR